MGEKGKKGNNAFSKKLDLKCNFKSHFGFQKMTMDVGSPVSICSRIPIKPRFQKVRFPLLGANEPILNLDINIDDDNVMKYLNHLQF